MAKVDLTLREFIHYWNATESDEDVFVDGFGSIAVCGGEIGLTPEGKKMFGSVLELKVENGVVVGTDEECQKAWDFLYSLAGYCASSDYEE